MPVKKYSPDYWMQYAISQALKAQDEDEVPVGAIVIKDNKIIGTGYNQVIGKNNPTAHAEIQALQNAGISMQNYRLLDTQLYVTLEPCMMCVGAMIHARIGSIYFGAYDTKTGMAQTVDTCFSKPYHNHRINFEGGILQARCAQLLQSFFKNKRLLKKHS